MFGQIGAVLHCIPRQAGMRHFLSSSPPPARSAQRHTAAAGGENTPRVLFTHTHGFPPVRGNSYPARDFITGAFPWDHGLHCCGDESTMATTNTMVDKLGVIETGSTRRIMLRPVIPLPCCGSEHQCFGILPSSPSRQEAAMVGVTVIFVLYIGKFPL